MLRTRRCSRAKAHAQRLTAKSSEGDATQGPATNTIPEQRPRGELLWAHSVGGEHSKHGSSRCTREPGLEVREDQDGAEDQAENGAGIEDGAGAGGGMGRPGS